MYKFFLDSNVNRISAYFIPSSSYGSSNGYGSNSGYGINNGYGSSSVGGYSGAKSSYDAQSPNAYSIYYQQLCGNLATTPQTNNLCSSLYGNDANNYYGNSANGYNNQYSQYPQGSYQSPNGYSQNMQSVYPQYDQSRSFSYGNRQQMPYQRTRKNKL